jgi:beta-glucosidase
MNAGNELLMPGTQRQRDALLAALQSGALSEDVLDRNVVRVLELVLRTPGFKGYAASNHPDLEAHARVAREAAADGMVLLRNEGALPLAPSTKVALLGNGSYSTITGGTGSGDVNEAYSVSLLQGLKDAGMGTDDDVARLYLRHIADEEARRPPTRQFMLPPPLAERTVPADEITRLAEAMDVGLVTITRNSGEFVDRKREGDFELSAIERALVADTAAAFHDRKKKLVVVLNVGGVVETASWRDQADAILLAWQPGQEAGRAVVDVLRGTRPPSGKLAVTFPVKWEDAPSSANFPGKTLLGPDPNARGGYFAGDRAAEVSYEDGIWIGYRHFATKGLVPAYPFGFGLSYTQFRYADLTLGAGEQPGELRASVTVTNTGLAPGREVVQLYLSAPGKGEPKPALELKGFAKTKMLTPGESETLAFTLTARDLASFDEASSSWRAEAGTYTVKIGGSSVDIRQTATFTKAKDETVGSVSGPVRAPSGGE